jgi:hypothetical protein
VRYTVRDPQGAEHVIEGPEGATPDQIIQKAQQLIASQPTSPGSTLDFIKSQAPAIAQKAFESVEPVSMTKNFYGTDPATMQRLGGPLLPIAGGAVGGPIGAAAGEAARQLTGTALAPDTVPQTALGSAANVIGAGIAQDPKILAGIPGVGPVAEMAANLASKTGKGLAKAAQALSGGKAGDFIEAAKKGLRTYAAPSKQEAGQMMQAALEKLPGERVAPTMVETVESAITPEASSGSRFLSDVAKRIDGGELIDARQALKAKQALDDVIDTVPVWQTKRRAKLFDLKKTFDDVLSSQAGDLKDASNEYRAASLKDNLTKPFPVNKHGEYSRLAGMLSTLGGSVAGSVAGHEGGSKAGAAGALAPLATAVALSPMSLGAAATTAGQFGKLAANPQVRQALFQALQKIMQSREQKNASPAQ